MSEESRPLTTKAEITRRTLAGEDDETVRVDIVSRHLRRHVDQVVANGKNRTEAIRIVAKASGLSVGAVTRAAVRPDTEWESEVVRRTLSGEDLQTALDGVIKEFLDAANPVAFVGAIEKNWGIPTLTLRYIAAVFDKHPQTNQPIKTIFEIEPLRQEGIIADGLRDFFWSAYDALVEGQDPGPEFWRMLALWLRAGHPKHWTADPLDVPVKVRLRFREKQRGSPPKAGRSINQAILGDLMARERANRTQYKRAAFKVRAEIERQARTENWEGNLPSETSIKTAYDRRQPPSDSDKPQRALRLSGT
jgi:hypothetical protein